MYEMVPSGDRLDKINCPLDMSYETLNNLPVPNKVNF